MIRIADILSYTNGNPHTFNNVHCIIMSILMLFVIEMLSAVRFAFNEKMITKIGVLTIIKRIFESKN
jgi:hypothetical protein